MRISFILAIILMHAPASAGQEQQAPPQHKSAVTKQTPAASEPPAVVNNLTATEKQESPKEQPKWWIPPPPWDIYWPTFGLVILTGCAVVAAIKTLRAINAQVVEMKQTGEQTDKLITESIAQTKSLVEQAESLAKSAYHLGESASATSRSASAMESVAEKIAVSTEAARESVSAINKQMRAYICVVIGSALYQERAKNIKFQAIPSIVNAGLTPAHKVSFQADAAILPVPLPEDFAFPLPDTTSGTSVIGPRQNITVSPDVKDFVDDTEVEGIKSGHQGKGLYTWGIFTYEDIFGNPQYTKFCHLYTWLGDGKTTWGYYAKHHNEAS